MVHFGEPDRATVVPNRLLFAGAGYRATVGFFIGEDISLACLVHLREAKGFFERDLIVGIQCNRMAHKPPHGLSR